jgi:hypothetical protein
METPESYWISLAGAIFDSRRLDGAIDQTRRFGLCQKELPFALDDAPIAGMVHPAE